MWLVWLISLFFTNFFVVALAFHSPASAHGKKKNALTSPPPLQDAYCLSERLAELNSGAFDGNLAAALQAYERARKPDTALVLAKSVVVGAIETLGGPLGEAFRDNFFFGMWKGGVAEQVFMDGAMPKV